MKLELGGGTLCPPDATNVDPVHGVGEWKRLAQDTPWPVADNTVDSIRASHVMEHVPSGQPRIDIFNEAWRVLAKSAHQPDSGTFEIIVPLMVAREAGEQLGWWAIADPTHVSYWVYESFLYFDGQFAANADYGIKLWETVSWDVVGGWEGHWMGTPR